MCTSAVMKPEEVTLVPEASGWMSFVWDIRKDGTEGVGSKQQTPKLWLELRNGYSVSKLAQCSRFLLGPNSKATSPWSEKWAASPCRATTVHGIWQPSVTHRFAFFSSLRYKTVSTMNTTVSPEPSTMPGRLQMLAKPSLIEWVNEWKTPISHPYKLSLEELQKGTGATVGQIA